MLTSLLLPLNTTRVGDAAGCIEPDLRSIRQQQLEHTTIGCCDSIQCIGICYCVVGVDQLSLLVLDAQAAIFDGAGIVLTNIHFLPIGKGQHCFVAAGHHDAGSCPFSVLQIV